MSKNFENVCLLFRSPNLPVFTTPGFFCIHNGKAKPITRELPIINKFREESRETFLRLEIPIAATIPKTKIEDVNK